MQFSVVTPFEGLKSHCIFPVTLSTTLGVTGEEAVLMALPGHLRTSMCHHTQRSFELSRGYPSLAAVPRSAQLVPYCR